jgi:uncharacterized protein
MARRQGGGMTVAEAGRMGGRLVSEKYGPGHFEKIGRKGGQKVADLIERAKSMESAEKVPEQSEEIEEPEETSAGS